MCCMYSFVCNPCLNYSVNIIIRKLLSATYSNNGVENMLCVLI